MPKNRYFHSFWSWCSFCTRLDKRMTKKISKQEVPESTVLKMSDLQKPILFSYLMSYVPFVHQDGFEKIWLN